MSVAGARPARLERGHAWPLGATWDGTGTNFAVYSAQATRVELSVFDATGRREVARMPLPECTDEVWHGCLPDAGPGTLYGYRVDGPYEPARGLRFNANKLLVDPYARALSGHLSWSDAVYGYRPGSARADLSFDRRDSARAMPKSVVVEGAYHWRDDKAPRVPWRDMVVYEAHVRGLTMGREDLRPEVRGTFDALGDPKLIEHLKRLGVTTLELLPIQSFAQDRFLVERKLANYWGYSPLAYFAPEPRYLGPSGADGLRTAIRRLHAAGIEVLLDVVYNHTCEGNELGPTLSLRGFDNAAYYRLQEDPRYYCNDTGCGNQLDATHPRTLQLILDSLRWWVTSFHVDGFRFDLGSTLGRTATGFDPHAPVFAAMLQDPVLASVKLVSEPWDCGPGGYQLGNHAPGFGEWNDRFRDGVRRFWRGEGGQRGELAARLAGSADYFDRRRRRPWASVNFVTSHDGFTLRDVVSYTDKHNEANGEENRDGHSENYSANFGVEGETDDAGIVDARRRVAQALLATLLLAHGTPMMLAGDELWRTQRGNNNAYCQDNELSWLDWSNAEAEPARTLVGLVAKCTGLRRELDPLRARRFHHGAETRLDGVRDIGWFDADGRELDESAWRDGEARTLALRLACDTDDRVELVLMLMNAGDAEATFALPGPAVPWQLRLDSARPGADATAADGDTFAVGPRSLVLLSANATR
ncbi:MAG TPA: glycogen debranching protein GlgX [Xanthomonadales bacterium]|nr:glycogen debranching protein GlgX [Xanthomonadales bacterium]